MEHEENLKTKKTMFHFENCKRHGSDSSPKGKEKSYNKKLPEI